MAIDIQTYSNVTGPSTFFKVAGHPLAADRAPAFIAEVARAGRIAVYDPLGFAAEFAALYDLSSWRVAEAYVQRIEDLGSQVLGRPVQPVTDLEHALADIVFIAAFDAERPRDQVRHLVPASGYHQHWEHLTTQVIPQMLDATGAAGSLVTPPIAAPP